MQMTRQVERQIARIKANRASSEAYKAARAEAKRVLLERQAAREKAEYYGRPVAMDISPSRSRIHSRTVKKGKPDGRLIWPDFHATKGPRKLRAALRLAA